MAVRHQQFFFDLHDLLADFVSFFDLGPHQLSFPACIKAVIKTPINVPTLKHARIINSCFIVIIFLSSPSERKIIHINAVQLCSFFFRRRFNIFPTQGFVTHAAGTAASRSF